MTPHRQTITCLIGDPVDHSVSDVMFQYFAKKTGLNDYHHLKFGVPADNKNNLKISLEALAIFDIAGANVTLPYKETIMKHIQVVDDFVKKVGAVNTVVNRQGVFYGYNTDSVGAVKAIVNKIRPIRKSDRVMIFGAGGAARAIIAGISDLTGEITVLSREADAVRAKKLKNDFARFKINIKLAPLSDSSIISTLKTSDIIINATPVGMYPNCRGTLLRRAHIESLLKTGMNIRNKVFFDAVFNPFLTDFLKLAAEYGGKICPGIYMMIYQGIAAFKLWTGKDFPEKDMRKIYILLRNRINSIYEK